MTLTAHRPTPRPLGPAQPTTGWRNPRLLLGLVLVAASVVVGARLMAAADDTVGVWVVARDLPTGATVDRRRSGAPTGAVPRRATADRYLSPPTTSPRHHAEPARVGRGAAATSRPRGGTGPTSSRCRSASPVDDLPATVRQGSVVDIWVAPKVAAVGAEAHGRPGAHDVVVVAVPRASNSLAPQSTRQVIVGVPAERPRLGKALGGMSDGRVVVAGRADRWPTG